MGRTTALFLRAQLRQHAQVFECGGVARDRLPTGNLLEQSPHDFSAARFWQRFREPGAATALLTPAADAGPARRLAAVGAAVELGAVGAMERRLGDLAEPYHQGPAGRYARLARGCTVLGAATVAVAGARRRWAAVAGSGLLLAGSAFERLAVYKAGFQSARDPKYVVKPQRARIEAANR